MAPVEAITGHNVADVDLTWLDDPMGAKFYAGLEREVGHDLLLELAGQGLNRFLEQLHGATRGFLDADDCAEAFVRYSKLANGMPTLDHPHV